MPAPGAFRPVPPRRGSPDPLYVQIRDQLAAAIESGVLAPGAAVASEPDLAAAFGVGRPTVRQAIALLRLQGLVVTRHGRGTFVTAGRVRAVPAGVDGMLRTPGGSDLRVLDELVDSGTVAHPPLQVLRVDEGGPWWTVTRVRHLADDGRPLCARTDAFSTRLVPGAERRFAATGSAEAAAAELDVATSQLAARAVVVPTAWRRPLAVGPGTPLLAVEQVDRTVSGAACRAVTVLLRTDLVPLVTEIADVAHRA